MNRKTFFISLLFAIAPSLAFASFVPGQTLDPQCLPSDSTCIVIGIASNVAGSFTATSTNATSTFSGGFSIGGSQFVVQQATGRIGIGTTSPFGLVDVVGSSNSTTLNLFDANRALSLINTDTTNNNASGFDFRTNDTAGLLTTGSKIMGVYTSHAAGAVSGDIAFLTRNAGTLSEKFRILANGNVGIGTTSPAYLLDVNGSAQISGPKLVTPDVFAIGSSTNPRISWGAGGARGISYLQLLPDSATTTTDITMGSSGGTLKIAAGVNGRGGMIQFIGGGCCFLNSGALIFNTGVVFGAVDPPQRMIIDPLGNVGIGTTTPGSILSVAGDIFSGGFYNTSGVTGGYKIDGNLILQASSSLTSLFIGGAGNASTTGAQSIVIGNGYSLNTTGAQNNVIGIFALSANTTGNFNNVMGRAAMNSNTTGNENTAVGTEALRTNGTGNDNVAVGMWAARGNGAATNTVAIGAYADGAAVAHFMQGSTLVGYSSGGNSRTGSDYNTFLGYQSGALLSTGSNNIWIGAASSSSAIANLSTGNQNILIGNNISLPSAAANGQLNIANILFGINNTGTGATVSSGSIGIGTSSPTAQFQTTGSVRFSNFGAGTLTTDANGNLSVSSDERLKNIDGQFTRGLSDIQKLSPISYHWNLLSGLDTTNSYTGFSAQNVLAAIPEAVGTSSNGFLTLQDRPILATIVNAIKDIGSISGDFKSAIVVWLGSNGNGLNRVVTDQLCVRDGSGATTCLSKAQLDALLSNGGSAGGAGIGSTTAKPSSETSSSTLPESTSTPGIGPQNSVATSSTSIE
jgi:hypothetical protein